MKTYQHTNGSLKILSRASIRFYPAFCLAISISVSRKQAADSLRDARKAGIKLKPTTV